MEDAIREAIRETLRDGYQFINPSEDLVERFREAAAKMKAGDISAMIDYGLPLELRSMRTTLCESSASLSFSRILELCHDLCYGVVRDDSSVLSECRRQASLFGEPTRSTVTKSHTSTTTTTTTLHKAASRITWPELVQSGAVQLRVIRSYDIALDSFLEGKGVDPIKLAAIADQFATVRSGLLKIRGEGAQLGEVSNIQPILRTFLLHFLDEFACDHDIMSGNAAKLQAKIGNLLVPGLTDLRVLRSGISDWERRLRVLVEVKNLLKFLAKSIAKSRAQNVANVLGFVQRLEDLEATAAAAEAEEHSSVATVAAGLTAMSVLTDHNGGPRARAGDRSRKKPQASGSQRALPSAERSDTVGSLLCDMIAVSIGVHYRDQEGRDTYVYTPLTFTALTAVKLIAFITLSTDSERREFIGGCEQSDPAHGAEGGDPEGEEDGEGGNDAGPNPEDGDGENGLPPDSQPDNPSKPPGRNGSARQASQYHGGTWGRGRAILGVSARTLVTSDPANCADDTHRDSAAPADREVRSAGNAQARSETCPHNAANALPIPVQNKAELPVICANDNENLPPHTRSRYCVLTEKNLALFNAQNM